MPDSRSQPDIVAVVRQHAELLLAAGGNLKALCPFHHETRPSFHVTPARGLWHCFGCGEGGDGAAFLAKIADRPANPDAGDGRGPGGRP